MGGRHDGNSVASGLSRTPCVGALSRTSTTWNCGLPKAKERRSSFDPGHLYRSHRGADFDGPYRRRRLQGLRLIVTERNNQALPAHYPVEYQRLRRDPGLIASAVEDMLRYDSPVQMLMRFGQHDTEVGGTRIESGAIVAVMFGAANRDPAQFPEPERFDVARSRND